MFAFILWAMCVSFASTNTVDVSGGNEQFARNFYNALDKENENVVFSPISAHSILSLLYQAASGNTAKHFERILNVTHQKSAADGYKSIMATLNNVQNITLNIANKVYVKRNFELKQSFKQIAVESFYSEVEPIDFVPSIKAAQVINNWVENKTANKIKNLCPPNSFDGSTEVALVNAIYFKGDWQYKFKKSATNTAAFHLSEDVKTDCQMMHHTGKFDYAENSYLNAQLLLLPYKNNDFSMLILLPQNKTEIGKLEEKAANVKIDDLLDQLMEAKVAVSLPRFKIETKIDLIPVLTKLGLGDLFGQPDLSGMLQRPGPLRISAAFQKAFIEVNEEGAEAAAATVMYTYRTMPRYLGTIPFVADHPFIFALIHWGNQPDILFMGKMSQP